MLSELMRKELRLALVPPAVIFELFAVMMLVPSYQFMIVFFYGLLGIFFVCMFGRENRDVEYTALLPVSRQDIVAARFVLSVCLELILVGLSAVFAALRPVLGIPQNIAGMDPDALFFGLGLLLMGVFNFIFFPSYYRNTNKIGIPFLIASLVFAAGLVLSEGGVALSGRSQADLPGKSWVLAGGIAAYAVLTWAAFRLSVKRFQKMNLNN